MGFSFSGLIYQIAIDPILSRLYGSVLLNVEPSHNVIDIACGTGSLAIAIAAKANHVTGIDLSEGMISTAVRTAKKRGTGNIVFELRDATDLSIYSDNEFDIAVTSMAIHQFEANQAVRIISEMKRVASKVIIVDYNYPMPRNFSRSLAFGIERFAGGDHYRNFRIYMDKGGIRFFTKAAGVTVRSEVPRGNDVFMIMTGE